MGSRDWRSFVYGGLASVAAELGSLISAARTFPIDTTKTRLQVQGQSGDKNLSQLKYKGMIDAFIKISKEEGFTALYSGIMPAALRQAVYGTIKFGTYYSLKRFVTENEIFTKKSEGESVGINILCAALAGAISSAIANPTDVLKVRLQVKGSGEVNIFKLFNEIYQQEGVRGLWRGVGPTAQRAIVLTGVELPLYDSIKNALLGSLGDSVANHTISSFIASLGGAVCSCPIDVVRTRLMNQKIIKKTNPNSPGPRIYKGSIDCAIQTVKHEGFMALYKGFIPTWMRMGPWNIIFFISYEELKKLY